MLEKLIKPKKTLVFGVLRNQLISDIRKAAVPLTILATSIIPTKALANYLSFINYQQKEYIVEIDEDKKQIQVAAESQEIAKQTAFRALVNQKSEDLERDVHSLEYEVLNVYRGKVKFAQSTANTVNYIESLLKAPKDARVPWLPFALEDYSDLKMKMIATEDAFHFRKSALNLLESVKTTDNPGRAYENLCIMDDNILKMTDYIKNFKEPPDILKNETIKFLIDGLWRTFNIDKLQKEFSELAEKYNLGNKEVAKLKDELEKNLEESRDYRSFRKSLETREVGKIVQKYDIILDPVEALFQQSYVVPLWTSANTKMQTPDEQEKANLEIKLEKSSLKNNDYNLRLWLLSDKVFNKTKTDVFIVHDKKIHLGKISEKAYSMMTKNNKQVRQWDEILPYGKDKSIVMQFDAVEWLFSKMISETMKGKIVKTNNLLSYFGDYLYNKDLETSQKDIEEIINVLEEKYTSKQIKINPAKGFRQTQGYLFLIPVKNSDDNLLFYMNLALESGSLQSNPSGQEEAFGRLEDIVISLKKKDLDKTVQVQRLNLPNLENEIKGYDKGLIEFMNNQEKNYEDNHPGTDYEYKIVDYNETFSRVSAGYSFMEKKSASEALNSLLNSKISETNSEIYETKKYVSFNLYLQKTSEGWKERESEVKEALSGIRDIINEYKAIHGAYPVNLESLNDDETKNYSSRPKLEQLMGSIDIYENDLIYEHGKIWYKAHLNW